MTDKITIERETLQEAVYAMENATMYDDADFAALDALKGALRAALAAQPAEPAYTHADVAEAHAKGYALGLRQVDRPHPTDAQPTGQSPCARHCEAPAFEGEIRRLKREATIKDSLTIRPPAPAAVPLTDEQIDDICWNFNCSNTPLVEYDRLIARAIERAHGIAAAGDKP